MPWEEVTRALLKQGVLGFMLLWALYSFDKANDKLITLMESTTRAVESLKNVCEECRNNGR
jgi:hypothetical protein